MAEIDYNDTENMLDDQDNDLEVIDDNNPADSDLEVENAQEVLAEAQPEVKIPKKRGRKPKNKELIIKSEVDNDADPSSKTDTIMKTKRRGRKPKDKFKYENTDFDEYQKNNKKEDNIVIKLPLSCLKLNEEFNIGKDLFPYNPTISTPKPYNPDYNLLHKSNIGYSTINDDRDLNEDTQTFDIETKINIDPNNFNNANFNQFFDAMKNDGKPLDISTIETKCDNTSSKTSTFCDKCTHCKLNRKDATEPDHEVRQIDIILNNKYNSNTDKFNVLTHLANNTMGGGWIDKTDVACLWCCHSFTGTPWGIPYKYVNGKFILFGNFCIANCALAHILIFYKDDESIWEI